MSIKLEDVRRPRGLESVERCGGQRHSGSVSGDLGDFSSACVVDELVAQYPLAAQALIAESRRLIRTAFPGVTETADTKARLIC
jgi:hypothetical protein